MKFKPTDEWLKQSEYDINTAFAMLHAGRYIYAVYMCHLSIEKALKGIYAYVYKKDPPKTHNLNYLVNKINEVKNLNISENHEEFIDLLNEKSVPVRYPDVLNQILKEYKKEATEKLLIEAKDLLEWIKSIPRN